MNCLIQNHQPLLWLNVFSANHGFTILPWSIEKEELHAQGQHFVLWGQKHARKRLCQEKLLSNSIYLCSHVVRYESNWQITENLFQLCSERQFEADISGNCSVCRWRGVSLALFQWPETTVVPAATTTVLHQSYLQTLASVVETCTIFNWPTKQAGQQREERGLSPQNNASARYQSHAFFMVSPVFLSLSSWGVRFHEYLRALFLCIG